MSVRLGDIMEQPLPPKGDFWGIRGDRNDKLWFNLKVSKMRTGDVARFFFKTNFEDLKGLRPIYRFYDRKQGKFLYSKKPQKGYEPIYYVPVYFIHKDAPSQPVVYQMPRKRYLELIAVLFEEYLVYNRKIDDLVVCMTVTKTGKKATNVRYEFAISYKYSPRSRKKKDNTKENKEDSNEEGEEEY